MQAVEQRLILPPGLQREDNILSSAVSGGFSVSSFASITVSCDDIGQRLKLCRGSPLQGLFTWVSGLEEAPVRIPREREDDELSSTVSDPFSVSSYASTTASYDDISQRFGLCRSRASPFRSTCMSGMEDAPVSDRLSVSGSASTTVGSDDISQRVRILQCSMAQATVCLPTSRAVAGGQCRKECGKDLSLFSRLWIFFLFCLYSWLQSVGEQVHKFMQEESPPLFSSPQDWENSIV